MTIVEALNALKEGKMVRNKIWEEHEYIMLKNGFIKYGNGSTHRIDIYGEYDICDDTWEEYKEPILDDKEKEYLSAVIKPFRDKVEYIKKIDMYLDCNKRCEYLLGKIDNKDDDDTLDAFALPYFPKGKMYNNMEIGKEYTLKELEL